jgi:hypothetical protein
MMSARLRPRVILPAPPASQAAEPSVHPGAKERRGEAGRGGMSSELSASTRLRTGFDARKGRCLFAAGPISQGERIEAAPVVVFSSEDARLIDRTPLFDWRRRHRLRSRQPMQPNPGALRAGRYCGRRGDHDPLLRSVVRAGGAVTVGRALLPQFDRPQG